MNGIKTDDRVENLEWCTNAENHKHACAMGLRKGAKGIKNASSKLSEEQVRIIRHLKNVIPKITRMEISQLFKISKQSITNIWRRKTWSHIK